MDQAHHQRFFNSSRDLMCVADADGKLRLVNPAFARTLGLAAGELTSRPILDFIHPEDRPSTIAALQDLTSASDFVRIENRCRCQDGTYRWLEWTVPPPDRHEGLLYATARDVTDQKRVISELSEHKGRLDGILRTAVDGIITIDDRGIVQSINPAAERIFGYSTQELVGHNISQLMPHPFCDEHDGYIHNYLRTGDRKIIGIGREVLGQRKDGSVFPADLAVSEMLLGDRRLFTGIVRDITDRKRAEAEQAILGRIVEDSLNELYFFDAETLHFIQVNYGARQNLGYEMNELRRLTPVDIKPEFSAERFQQLLAPLKNGQEEKIVFETVHRRKDGSTYDVEVHLQMGHLRERHVFVAIILDVTTRKEMDRQLTRLNQELEQRVRQRTAELESAQEQLLQKEKLATLGRLSGSIAHEIRNPLNAVKTSAYYLLHSQNAGADKVREHLERIDRQVSQADYVVTTMCDFARLPIPVFVDTELRPCLEEAVKASSVPDNICVEINVDSAMPPIRADRDQIGIALQNIIRNARDAMPDGGTIRVDARTLVDGNTIQVNVIDQGEGIPPHMLETIMEPLYSTKTRGMGLGLAITKSIVEKNNGRLNVSSVVGKGSTFTIELSSAAPPSGI